MSSVVGEELVETWVPSFHGDWTTNPWLPKMPYRLLGRTNLKLSLLSYGGSALGNFYGSVDLAECKETLVECIRNGINYLDTSPWYGDSESIMGEALHGVPRGAYYIGTKVGRNSTPTWHNRFDYTRQAILRNVESSLTKLGLDYIDIIQVHDVEFCLDRSVLLTETLPALESVVRAGKAKYIGITGYDLELLQSLSAQSPIVDTVLNYARFNLYDTSLETSVPAFVERKLGIINASPVGMGLLTTRGPPSWHPASPEVKAAAREAATLASNLGTTLETAALGFSLRPSNPNISTTLVSMTNGKMMRDNLELVTKPVTKIDEGIYCKIKQVFEKVGSCSWEGKELDEYKTFLKAKE